jgi:hypothetical protein
MDELAIKLIGEHRPDGSVCVSSPDLPLFCIIGANESDALDLAMKILPEYLKANVPQFVALKPIPSAMKAISPVPSENTGILPAHIIALRKGSDAATGSKNHG